MKMKPSKTIETAMRVSRQPLLALWTVLLSSGCLFEPSRQRAYLIGETYDVEIDKATARESLTIEKDKERFVYSYLIPEGTGHKSTFEFEFYTLGKAVGGSESAQFAASEADPNADFQIVDSAGERVLLEKAENGVPMYSYRGSIVLYISYVASPNWIRFAVANDSYNVQAGIGRLWIPE